MTIRELKKEIQQYVHLEDTKILDVLMATVIANRLKLNGDPVWLVVIGVSSGGKSQILRPISLIDEEDNEKRRIIHKIDDLTENTFLSGMQLGGGDTSNSLLKRIGNIGLFIISDMTVLFSKSPESRATILSQFRMLYDGEMTKMSGNMKEPLTWKGYLGIVAGSTPSIYREFEQYADMGERFMYFRMKENDNNKVLDLALNRKMGGRELDEAIGGLYKDYVKDVIGNFDRDEEIELPHAVIERIKEVSTLAEKIRTPIKTNFVGDLITHIPVTASPARSAQQLASVAKGLMVMAKHDDRSEKRAIEDILEVIDWLAYSFANEEKRRVLNLLAELDYDGRGIETGDLEDAMGLNRQIISQILLNLTAVDIVEKCGTEVNLYKIKHKNDWETVRRINSIDVKKEYEKRVNVEEF